MRHSIVACQVLALAFLASPAGAQTRPDPLSAYRSRALEFRFDWWSGYDLYQGGVEIDASDALFADAPEALEHFNASQALHVLGIVGVIAGVTAAVVGYVVWKPGATDDNPEVGVPLVIGGFVLDITGGILIGVGRERVSDAVTAYNTALFEELRRERSPSVSPRSHDQAD